MHIAGNLFMVSRKHEINPELGYNQVLVCARDENEAKGIALASCDLRRTYMNESKKDIIVTKIEEIKIGDVLLKA